MTKAEVDGFRELVEIQCSTGNWNYSPYMYGMANGMILALHIMEGSEGLVPYLDAPETWLEGSPAQEVHPDEQ